MYCKDIHRRYAGKKGKVWTDKRRRVYMRVSVVRDASEERGSTAGGGWVRAVQSG
jgi:hypothetical protein